MNDAFKEISSVIDVQSGFAFPSTSFIDDGVPIVRMSDLKSGQLDFKNAKYVSDIWLKICPDVALNEGDFLMGMSGSLSNNAFVSNNDIPALLNQRVARIKKKGAGGDYGYICFWLQSEFYTRYAEIQGEGAAQKNISGNQIAAFKVRLPKLEEQEKISEILLSIDTAIEKTDSLIAKYQKIKAGLMHDLFTRGVTADGKLRPPREQAPELYQETPVGWIPVEWEFDSISSIMESLIDGPFGSNLKTEHYVIDPGVRVVRLQNIQATSYNDNDRAYISDKHAAFLLRNKVLSGDILIAGLGEDRYPVGHACLYPNNLPPAINKADCFRLRCKVEEAENPFVMLYLNTEPARVQIRKYEQGVTRPRINSGNFKKLIIPKPSVEEQKIIAGQIMKVTEKIEIEKKLNHKYIMEKLGLLHDLLIGKVSVRVDEQVVEALGD